MVRAGLETDAAALLRPEWLAAQRWYGANDRELLGVGLTDAAPLPAAPGQPLLPLANGWLLVLAARFADGGEARYLIPATYDGDRLREPTDGDGAWARLASAILDHAVLVGESGSFRCESSQTTPPVFDGSPAAAGGLLERRLGVEQTNTSVRLGEQLILKIYRRLQDGVNPEIEVGAFLESVGCDVVPRMAGEMQYVGSDLHAAAAMLQERVVSVGDAWEEIGAKLAGDDGGPAAALRSVAAIGEVTARLHAALAARPRDVAFPVREAQPEEVEAWRDAALAQVARAADAARGDAVDPELFAAVRARVDTAFRAMPGARVTRIHGDYHLGQLLRTPDAYAVIDFEGEPARPLPERRAPQPPERDVAGMLRSFDYAARTAQRRSGGSFAADAWLARARGTFLSAYAETAPAAHDVKLLAAFELEKACYEVSYEAANRPGWVWLPLEALRGLAAARGPSVRAR